MWGRLPGACAAALALFLAAAHAAADPRVGTVEGRVSLAISGLALADVAPVVVYLDRVGGTLDYDPPRAIATVRQRDARFVPRFLVVAAGQSVDMPNDDLIYHNVFSYSKRNAFDLGLYPSGRSKTVQLRYPGVVKTYCSIHESMNGTIFVAPSPYHQTVSDAGRFSIPGVPPGRYRAAAWSERLPRTQKTIEVRAGGRVSVELVLGDASGGPVNSTPTPPPPAARGR